MFITTIGDELGESLIEQIRILKKFEINCIEIRKINNNYLWQFSENEIKEMKKVLDENDFITLTLDTPIGKKDNAFCYEKNIYLLKKYLNLAQILNAKYLRIFSDIGERRQKENIIKVLRNFSNLALEKNIELLMENEKNTFAESIDVCGKLIQNLENVNILFDIENSSYKNFDIIREYSNNREKVKYIHLRDFDNEKGIYTFIGEGTLPLLKLFNKLKENNYNGVISLETMLPKYIKDISKEKIFNKSYSKFIKLYKEA